MNIIDERKIDATLVFIIGLLSLSSCISEALSRNCVKVLLLVLLIRCVIKPNILHGLCQIKGLLISMIAFFCMWFISAIYGGHFDEVSSESMFSTQYTALLLPACLLLINKKENVYIFLYGLFFSMLVTDIYVFYQVWNGEFRPVPLIAAGVMKGTCLFVTLIPAMLINFFDSSAPLVGRIFAVVCAVVSLIGLIFTNTRGGWLAIIPVVVGILLYYVPTWKKKVCVVMSCVMLAGFAIAFVPSISDRADSITQGRKQQSVNERFLMWGSAVRMGLDHPVLGVGNGNYKHYYQNEYISEQAKEPDVGHAHNMFFQMFGENGFIGLFTYCGMIIMFLLYGYRRKSPMAKIVLFSTLGLVLYGFTDYTLSAYESMRVYWFLMGLCVCGVELQNK